MFNPTRSPLLIRVELVTAASCLCWLCTCVQALFAQDDPPAPVAVIRVVVAPLYEEIPLTATVTSPRLSRISPRVAGLVSEVLVDAGDSVSKGDPLLRLDEVLARIELEQSGAQLNEARARLKEAKRQRDEAAELVKTKNIPSTTYEASIAEVEINEATVARLKAAYEMQQEILARHNILAPFDGVVTGKLVESGEWVDTRTPLFELAQIDVLRIDIPLPQYYYNHVAVGTPVSIRFDSLPDRIFNERITMKVPMGSTSARTFPVRIDMRNDERVIAPGMSARVNIRLQQTDRALLLPRDTIVRKPDGGELVWVLEEGPEYPRVRSMQVRTGRSFRDYVEIVDSGLRLDDRVVVRGNEVLTQNQAVRIAEVIEPDLGPVTQTAGDTLNAEPGSM